MVGLLGGIVGVAYGTSISDCYSVASVKSGTWFQGGLVGCAYGSGGVSTSITNSYSTGLINDGNTAGNVGGMVGKDYDLTVVGSFWDTDTSGQANSAGGTGKTTAEMKVASLYIGWDFALETANGTEDVWEMDNANGVINGGYPFLGWENGGAVVYDMPTVITSISDILTQSTADQTITVTATDGDGGCDGDRGEFF